MSQRDGLGHVVRSYSTSAEIHGPRSPSLLMCTRFWSMRMRKTCRSAAAFTHRFVAFIVAKPTLASASSARDPGLRPAAPISKTGRQRAGIG